MIAEALLVFLSVVVASHSFELTIVHTNDVHARFEQANSVGGNCRDPTKCFGGVARRMTKIRELNATEPNMILLDAGDQYQGTLWFHVYKGHAAAHFMNKLGYQAMALGNHEFDLGVSGLLPLLNNANFPILSANIDARQEPSINGKFLPSTVLEVGGERIGIIGYTTTETPSIATTGKLIFNDEITTIQPIINQMTTAGINKIILLGHSGYTRDRELARGLRGVDVIVGGHSHSFLYTGIPPTNDEVIGPYPTIETNLDGDKVLVVQDFFFGKYLGFLQVNFTQDGKVGGYNGDPILLNASIAEDPEILEDIRKYKEEVLNVSRVTVGSNLVYLQGERTVCRLRECNLGNLVADSMVWRIAQLDAPNGTWTTAAVGLMNSGGVRSSVEPGEVSTADVLTVMPFGNNIDVIFVKGRVLVKALEHAVAKYDPKSPRGEFLQVSGLQIVYNLDKPVGERLVSVLVLCDRCEVPTYGPVEPDEVYPIVLPEFTANGGDGFDFELGPNDRLNIGFLDSDVFTNYIQQNSPLYKSVEGRIRLCGQDSSVYCPPEPENTNKPDGTTTCGPVGSAGRISETQYLIAGYSLYLMLLLLLTV